MGRADVRSRIFVSLIWLAGIFACGMAAAQPFSSLVDTARALTPQDRLQIEQSIQRMSANQQVPLVVAAVSSLSASEVMLNNIINDLTQASNAEHAIIMVWSQADDYVYLSLGEGWRDEDRQLMLREAGSLYARETERASVSVALAAIVSELESIVRIRESYFHRFLYLVKNEFNLMSARLTYPSWRTVAAFFSLNILIAVGVLFLWELIAPWRTQQKHRRPQLVLDLFYTFLQKPLFFALIGSALVGITDFAFRDFLARVFGVQNMVAVQLDLLPLWSRYLLLFLMVDFLGYWGHRVLHRVDFLWQFHKVHHSARQLDVFNATRQHIVEVLFYRLFLYVPMGLVGFGITETFIVLMIQSFLSTFTHANVRVPLGPLKYLINNPQLHIWHHTVEIHDRGNVNFGDALSIWDFIFGTGYAPADRTDLELGFEDIESYPTTFWRQFAEPFRALFKK